MSTEPSAAAGDESAVQQVTAQAQEKAGQLAGQAQEQASQAAGEAKNRLRRQLDERSAQAAEQMNGHASDLRAVSDSLREQGKDGPARAAAKLAGYAEQVGGYLHDRDSDALLADVEDFGRRQPWAVAAGGLALGFAASRFLKASSSRRYASRSSTGRVAPPASSVPYPPPAADPSADRHPAASAAASPSREPLHADGGVNAPEEPTLTGGL